MRNNLIRRLYPDGVLIDDKVALQDAIAFTYAHLARSPQSPLLEATFSEGRVWMQADISIKRKMVSNSRR